MKNKLKMYKGIFIDRFTKRNKPVHYKLFKWVENIGKGSNFNIKPIEVIRGELHEKLIRDILNADVVISCMSRSRNSKSKNSYENVVFETAMRQTFRKPIIIVCSKTKDIGKLPFYLRDCNIIKHKDEEKILKALTDCIDKPDVPDNRIWEIINRIEEENNKRLSEIFEIWPSQILELWKVGPAGSIVVRGTYLGGYIKGGIEWKSYNLKFKMKILNKSLGVIIKLKPWESGLMLQFSSKEQLIKPHRYVKTLSYQLGYIFIGKSTVRCY
ncbi:MAG: hypothetical protein AABY84_01370 [Candidatus Firestonebacteria bacterium]